MKRIQWLTTFLLFVAVSATAQRAEEKTYTNQMAGDVQLLKSWAEWNGKSSEKVYTINVADEARYYISALANLPNRSFTKIKIDGKEGSAVYTDKGDWKWVGSELPAFILKPGLHEIRIDNNSPMVPMIDDIFLHKNSSSAVKMPETINSFFLKLDQLKRQSPAMAEKVLSNPQGNYNHAIDTSFTYSNYSTIYLPAGSHTITTSGSTTSPNLVVFEQGFAWSGSNSNGGANGEAFLGVLAPVNAYYVIMLRPTYNGSSGVTNIVVDGNTVTSNAIIGGQYFNTSSLKGGTRNFFTCRLTGGGDTRMIVSRYSTSSARAYNDDYSGTGTFNWGYASRIKKNFTGDSVQYVFVCAYSASSTGKCDVYMGNENSNVNKDNVSEFVLLEPDDAILTANTGYYNCISWSGGVTSTWIWPPSEYSTYNCPNNDQNITCFDNFYGNNPLRYPGARTYTRTGATNANSIVDVWKLNTHYTHGSVRKPGNNHPHGYDWESKPGGLDRTFHPRTALTNNSTGYGSISNYYIFDPNAKSAFKYDTDEEAIKAGVAIYDQAKLTGGAQLKLRLLIGKINTDLVSQFNKLYDAWDKTKVKNALYSDPAMYCKNPEFEAMVLLAKKNARNVMILSMDKFVNSNDHFIGELLWTLSKTTYGQLLTEVKQERIAKPNDEQGRYRIHGDHDNGVLYVEKILKDLQPIDETPVATELITFNLSPNPVTDRYTIKLVLPKEAMVSVKVTYAQSRQVTVLQQPVKLSAGVHVFNGSVNKGLVPSGEILTVQAEIDGEVKAIKAIIMK